MHVAAAAHRPRIISDLLDHAADVTARNRRGAHPLHYAVDARPDSALWDPGPQQECVTLLLRAGADPNAFDTVGSSPLHRAIRNRCAGVVRVLLAGGADPRAPNSRGSTPMDLARRPTGRGGSGSPQARAEQAQIIRLLEQAGEPG